MRCPYCARAELEASPNSATYSCPRCRRMYEIVAGRPPRRLFNSAPGDPTQWSPPPGAAPQDIAISEAARLLNDIDMQAVRAVWTDDTTLQPVQPDLAPPGTPAPDVPEGERMLHTLTLPPGWQWLPGYEPNATAQFAYVQLSPQHVAYQGTPQAGQASYTDRIASLVALLDEHSLKLVVNRNENVELSGDGWGPLTTAVPNQFLICIPRYFDYNYGGRDWVADWHYRNRNGCEHCGSPHSVGALVCPTTGNPIQCYACNRSSASGAGFDRGHQAWYCNSCASDCCDCGQLCPSGYDYCSECRRRETCRICRQFEEIPDGGASFVNSDSVCAVCVTRQCPECQAYSRHALQWSPVQERMLCRNCWQGSLTDILEGTDDSDDDTAAIPSIPGRENIRMCGIELEGGNGTRDGANLARALYNAGLSPYNSVQGYHHGGGAFCHVEADSSVDWELVMGPVNPADAEQMKSVNQAIRIVRQGIHSGKYKFDLRCGLHVHVGAEKFGLAQAFNLNTLFSYVEDVMFRLSAAKWPIHRSMTGSPYCDPVQKSTSKLAFGREVGQAEERNARRVALNFRNYFQRMLGNCHCGAVRFDSWEDCTCDLGKCTFEFRLFNATANPRKLHAYLALSQALVAKAGGLPEIIDPSAEYPAQTFIPKPAKGMEDDELIQAMADWLPRLRWILTELPLTDEEKESVMYCVRNSDLALLGDGALVELLPTTEEVTA